MPEATETRRFRLTIAYDGRPFEGWQSQAGGNTVQDILQDAIRGICADVATVQGSGRTDAGVSAEGQVAHFDVPTDWSMGAGEWLRAINSKLPRTIRIMDSALVEPGFHARFGAVSKSYRYRIWTGTVLPPLQAGLAWHRPGIGNLQSFPGIVSLFEGTHDFRAFSAKRKDGRDEERNTTRTISRASVSREGDRIDLEFDGDGFLYRMVRFLAGSAVRAVEGKLTAEQIRLQLKTGTRDGESVFCAPPDGLTLVKVRYSG